MCGIVPAKLVMSKMRDVPVRRKRICTICGVGPTKLASRHQRARFAGEMKDNSRGMVIKKTHAMYVLPLAVSARE
jgi:hypothetical protein